MTVTSGNNQNDVSLAALTGGDYAATYTDYSQDPNGNIKGRLFHADGTPGAIFSVAASGFPDTDSDVAALADGGFVASWTLGLGGGDNDIHARIFNADGSVRVGNVDVNINLHNTRHSSVAGLAGGGFATAWEEAPAGGGASELRFALFDSSGQQTRATPRPAS